jgi:hypothetical protein
LLRVNKQRQSTKQMQQMQQNGGSAATVFRAAPLAFETTPAAVADLGACLPFFCCCRGDAELKKQGDAAVAAAFEKSVWPQFVQVLTSADGPRFAVIDFVYTTKDGRIQKTLVSVGWCPDKGTPAKQKMVSKWEKRQASSNGGSARINSELIFPCLFLFGFFPSPRPSLPPRLLSR